MSDEFHLTERLMVGHPVIDADHQQLVDLLNASTRELSAGNYPAFMTLFEEMVEHCRMHFKREEAILKSLGFPYSADHAEYHVHMQDELDERLLRYRRTAEYDNPEAFFLAMAKYLIHDFVSKDLEFKSFMQEVL